MRMVLTTGGVPGSRPASFNGDVISEEVDTNRWSARSGGGCNVGVMKWPATAPMAISPGPKASPDEALFLQVNSGVAHVSRRQWPLH